MRFRVSRGLHLTPYKEEVRVLRGYDDGLGSLRMPRSRIAVLVLLSAFAFAHVAAITLRYPAFTQGRSPLRKFKQLSGV